MTEESEITDNAGTSGTSGIADIAPFRKSQPTTRRRQEINKVCPQCNMSICKQ